MGMKPRKKPAEMKPTKEANVIEHDNAAVKALCITMPRIAEDPAECIEAMAWLMALIIDRLVPEGDTDDAIDSLRNEIMLKTCMLKAFPEEKAEPLWDWIDEGLDAINKEMN